MKKKWVCGLILLFGIVLYPKWPAKVFAAHLLDADNKNFKSECPVTLECRFIPAVHVQRNPDDQADYGNYDQANRPTDMPIKYIVIHVAEGSYDGTIAHFQNPNSKVSTHYVIRSADGEVTQMVKTKDVAWHAGNWYMNMHSIGIEHEGFSREGQKWFTKDMYRSLARLVHYLAHRYNIPIDREHILGHNEYQSPTPAGVTRMHWDPGPYWDWDYFMELLGAPIFAKSGFNSPVVTFSPQFKTNQPSVTSCTKDGCQELPKQPTNFIYLRTEPQDDAPLVKDGAFHPDG
jgi:N-acetyl-anhydromuramyl-L-alanine amidase AmpD